jgi:hypothetical protein
LPVAVQLVFFSQGFSPLFHPGFASWIPQETPSVVDVAPPH